VTIPVDLHSKENKAALAAAVDVLRGAHLVNISPEAKRNYTDELLLPFKYGTVSMAQKTNSPIVPYAISGDYKLFSNNLKIVFGEPFYTDDRELSDANSELYHRVMKLLIENMSQSELKKKHITTFEEWSRKNEKAS